jgi:hypothetical protein
MGRTGFFRVNPVRPGSNRVGRVIPGQHGSTRVERVTSWAPLGHPERTRSRGRVIPRHIANPVFFSVHLTRPIRVNPTNPGQPGKPRFDPFFSRLLRR